MAQINVAHDLLRAGARHARPRGDRPRSAAAPQRHGDASPSRRALARRAGPACARPRAAAGARGSRGRGRRDAGVAVEEPARGARRDPTAGSCGCSTTRSPTGCAACASTGWRRSRAAGLAAQAHGHPSGCSRATAGGRRSRTSFRPPRCRSSSTSRAPSRPSFVAWAGQPPSWVVCGSASARYGYRHRVAHGYPVPDRPQPPRRRWARGDRSTALTSRRGLRVEVKRHNGGWAVRHGTIPASRGRTAPTPSWSTR